jgi:hypothetical protein
MVDTLAPTMGRPKKHIDGTESTRFPKWFMRRCRIICAVTGESIPDYILRTMEAPSKRDFDKAMREAPKNVNEPKSAD